jgi:hypothetical protein
MSNGAINVVNNSVTTLNHVPVLELHCLGTLSSNLSTDNNFASLCAFLHYQAHNSIASSANGKASQQLELEGLGLSLGAQSSVGNLLGVKFQTSVGHVESLLHGRGELSDSSTLHSKHVLGVGGLHDNLSAHRCLTNSDPRVSFLGQLVLEEFVQLGTEHSVGNELSLLGNLSGSWHFWSFIVW